MELEDEKKGEDIEKKGEDITILPQNPKKRMVEEDIPLERRNHETPKIPSPSPSLSSP